MKKIQCLVLALAMSGSAGCALFGRGVQSMSASPKLPAAEGKVDFATSKNDNTVVDLKVKHLAHPEKLSPAANTYVVWTRATEGAPPQNIGALKVDKNLTGELQTEVPLHSFELFITAEDSGQVQQPAGERLVWTNYSR